jgi:hypothetical protein
MYNTTRSNIRTSVAFSPGGGKATLTVGFPDHLPFMSSMISRQPIGALGVFSGTDGPGCQAAAINNSRSNIKKNLAFQLNHVTVLRTRVLPDFQWEIDVTYDSVDCGPVNYASANFGSVSHGLAAMLPPGVTNRAVSTKGVSGI